MIDKLDIRLCDSLIQKLWDEDKDKKLSKKIKELNKVFEKNNITIKCDNCGIEHIKKYRISKIYGHTFLFLETCEKCETHYNLMMACNL